MKIVMKGDNISRSALIRQIEIDADGSPGWYGDTWQFIKTIAKMPSTDRTGHWIAEASDKILGRLNWSCSECGEGFALDIGKCPTDIGMNYCTNCGADMRGEEE